MIKLNRNELEMLRRLEGSKKTTLEDILLDIGCDPKPFYPQKYSSKRQPKRDYRTNSKVTHHRNAIKELLKKHSLNQIQEAALEYPKTSQGNAEFLKFQRRVFEVIFTGFRIDFCRVNVVELDNSFTLTSSKTIKLNLPDEIEENYRLNAQYDELSPLLYINPGRAIGLSHIVSSEGLVKHPFYTNHLVKYGIRHQTSIAYIFPGNLRKFVSFSYMGNEANEDWNKVYRARLELASFPFLLTWLFRFGHIDKGELARRLELMEGFTEIQLQNLRKFVNAPHQTFRESSKELGIKEGTLKEALYATRDRVLPTIKRHSSHEFIGRSPGLRILESQYNFLQMLGDHTKELNRP